MTTPKPRADYHSDDRELLVGVYRWLFWRWMLLLIPRWVSPNALTILGLAASVGAVGAALAGAAGHTGMYLASAILLFVYVSLDNLDGAHARRTGQSSHLGELLDHGLDGLASGSMLLIGAITMHLDPFFTVLLVLVGTVAFVQTLWEQYRTNLLVIPQLSGTEGVTVVGALGVLAFAYNDPAWLHVDLSRWSVGAGFMTFALFGYLMALVPPFVRARKAGASPAELGPIIAVFGSLGAFVIAGADPILTGAVIAVLGSDLGARLILLRQAEQEERLLPLSRLWVVVPLLPALAVRQPDVANLAAGTSLALASVIYLSALVEAARAQDAAPA